MQVKSVFICNNKRVVNGLPQHLGGHGEVIRFRIASVWNVHLNFAGHVQIAAVRAAPVAGAFDLRVVGAVTEKFQIVDEKTVRERIALDRAVDRCVRAAGGLSVRLPRQLQIEVNAALQTQNKGEFRVRFDCLAVLVFLHGVGADGEDVVLVVRAVRERHLNCAARVRLLWYAVARGDLHASDFRVIRV